MWFARGPQALSGRCGADVQIASATGIRPGAWEWLGRAMRATGWVGT